MELKRVRKAVFAGVSSAVIVAVTAWYQGQPDMTSTEWAGLFAAVVADLVVVGMGTYNVRNSGAGLVNGSQAPIVGR